MENSLAHKIPALVISGFLGSGKTTLVRVLLEEARHTGQRVALVSNELGELGIDRALLGQGDEAYVELEGGCVCCELSDDLVETLQMLWEKVHPDRVVIETSGVALPWDTQLNFWREPVCHWIGDDVTVVVVNAEQLAEGRDLEGTFQDQVSSTDLLVLNKIDLVDPARLPELDARLRELEPEAPVIHCVHGQVDPALFFPPELGSVDRSGAPPQSTPHQHEHFETEEVRIESGIDEKELASRLQEPGLLRAKGFVETSGGLRLVQVVGGRIELGEVDVVPDPTLLGRLVLIRRASADVQ
jgi:G3E family GTPase